MTRRQLLITYCVDCGRVLVRTGKYRLEGLDGEYRTAVARPVMRSWLARHSARLPADVRSDAWRIGRWRDRLIWFRPLPGQ